MADIVKYSEIISKVAYELKKEFQCKVYSDEVLENFTKPRFFIKLIITSEKQTVNIIKKQLSVILTYFPADADISQLHYLDVYDRISRLFENGLRLKSRYLHTNNIEFNRAGENMDILQFTIDLPYLDRAIISKPSCETMEELEINVKINEREEAKWQS